MSSSVLLCGVSTPALTTQEYRDARFTRTEGDLYAPDTDALVKLEIELDIDSHTLGHVEKTRPKMKTK